LILFGGAFIALRHQQFIRDMPGLGRLASIDVQGGETKTRLVIWGMAWQGLKERPITGWGQENFSYVFNKYYKPELWGQEQWFDRAHNSYVDWAINAGVLGFALFVSLFFAALWTVARARELPVIERSILIGLLVGFAIHEVFVFDNIVSWILFFAVLAFVHTLHRRKTAATAAPPLGDNGIAVVAPIVGIAAIVGIWYLNAPGIATAMTLIRALQPTPTSVGVAGPMQNLAYFKDALAQGMLGRQEVVEQLLEAGMSLAGDQSASDEVKQAYYAAGVDAMLALQHERPHDARLELFLGNMYARFGNTDKALEALQMSAEDSPSKQQILFTLALDGYQRKGNTEKALETMQKAYKLDPSYDDARVYYAALLSASGKGAEADQLLTEKFGSTIVDNDALLTAYLATKQYARAAAILEERVKKNPKDTQAWMNLASVYYQAGDRAKTVEALQKAKAANPDIAGQVDKLIEQVQQQK
jgi:tetratricopeptide (TPR) repeat protein